jgi:hypothetical protein
VACVRYATLTVFARGQSSVSCDDLFVGGVVGQRTAAATVVNVVVVGGGGGSEARPVTFGQAKTENREQKNE